MAYKKGWSLMRGRATHYWDPNKIDRKQDIQALCGAPIRLTMESEGIRKSRLYKLEICDHCQNARNSKKKA